MKRKSIKKAGLVLAVSSLVFFSCKGEGKSTTDNSENNIPEQVLVDEHNAKTSLDWDGTYTGTLPCASCSGIETTLKLNPDLTFELTQLYLDVNEGEEDSFTEKGTFTWGEKGTNITLNLEDGTSMYKITEDAIIALDADGKVVEGELAKHYILKKVE